MSKPEIAKKTYTEANWEALPGFQSLNNKRESYKKTSSVGNYLATKTFSLISGMTNLLSLFIATIGAAVTLGRKDTVNDKVKGSAIQFGMSMKDLFWLKVDVEKKGVAGHV